MLLNEDGLSAIRIAHIERGSSAQQAAVVIRQHDAIIPGLVGRGARQPEDVIGLAGEVHVVELPLQLQGAGGRRSGDGKIGAGARRYALLHRLDKNGRRRGPGLRGIIHWVEVSGVRLDVGNDLPRDGSRADVEVVVADVQVIEGIHWRQRADVSEPVTVEVEFAQVSTGQRIQRREPIRVEGKLVQIGKCEDKRHRLQSVVVQFEIPQVHQVGDRVEIHVRTVVQVENVQIRQPCQWRDAGQTGIVMEVELRQTGQAREHRHARQGKLANAQIGQVGQAAEEREADDARVVIEGKLIQGGQAAEGGDVGQVVAVEVENVQGGEVGCEIRVGDRIVISPQPEQVSSQGRRQIVHVAISKVQLCEARHVRGEGNTAQANGGGVKLYHVGQTVQGARVGGCAVVAQSQVGQRGQSSQRAQVIDPQVAQVQPLQVPQIRQKRRVANGIVGRVAIPANVEVTEVGQPGERRSVGDLIGGNFQPRQLMEVCHYGNIRQPGRAITPNLEECEIGGVLEAGEVHDATTIGGEVGEAG